MNQSWEIIGIVIAVLMVIIGLVILLKKPNHAAPPVQDELLVDPLSQQPIVPRHLRQLIDEDESESSVATTASTANTTTPPASVETSSALNPLQAQAAQANSVAPVEATANPPEQSHPDQPQTAAANAAMQSSIVEEKPEPKDVSITIAQPIDLEPASEQIQVEEKIPVNAIENTTWETESDVLDAHLNEQIRHDEESALATAQQLLALYLYPNPQRALSGERALKMLLKYGLRFGEMSCFHRYEDSEKVSPLMFSVLRINDDGAPTGFDLETLPSEEVKGLAFFLTLPNPEAVKGFDMMVSLAGLMARDIDGMVFDEQSLELTPQLRDHWRHYVIEYKAE